LKYTRLRGDMTNVIKLLHDTYDPEVSLKLVIKLVQGSVATCLR